MRCKIFSLIICLAITALFLKPSSAWSAGTKNCPSQANCSLTDDQCWKTLVENCQEDVASLQSQINTLKGQINLNRIKIVNTENKIGDLQDEIATLSGKIDRLESSLSTVINVLIERIVATYKSGAEEYLSLLLTSNGFSNFLTRAKYIRIVQEHDKKLLFQMQETKNNYVDQKAEREKKKNELAELQKQLIFQKTSLEQNEKDLQTLYIEAKNSASYYEKKYEAAIEEQRAIERIKAGGGNAVSVGPVKTGDIVGHIIDGPSACSSGAHLHFEVHKDDNIVDPSQYLRNVSYSYDFDTSSISDRISPNGSWNWPIDDKILIEQAYGMTFWARRGWYRGGPHTGIDMFSDSNLSVKAVQDGTLFRGSIACGGGSLYFARVDQKDGIQTFYLHITP